MRRSNLSRHERARLSVQEIASQKALAMTRAEQLQLFFVPWCLGGRFSDSLLARARPVMGFRRERGVQDRLRDALGAPAKRRLKRGRRD